MGVFFVDTKILIKEEFSTAIKSTSLLQDSNWQITADCLGIPSVPYNWGVAPLSTKDSVVFVAFGKCLSLV